MRRSELLRRLADLEEFSEPDPALEQVSTPPELTADLLESALARGDLVDRVVADLGTGPGRIAVGAALLGARRVVGVDSDERALTVARRNAARSGVLLDLRSGSVETFAEPVDTVVMNPPFGAQRRHADRPFWEAAFRCARGAIYAFALAESRTFIARWAVERSVPIFETRRVRFELSARFRHHRKRSVTLAVDLWVLGAAQTNP